MFGGDGRRLGQSFGAGRQARADWVARQLAAAPAGAANSANDPVPANPQKTAENCHFWHSGLMPVAGSPVAGSSRMAVFCAFRGIRRLIANYRNAGTGAGWAGQIGASDQEDRRRAASRQLTSPGPLIVGGWLARNGGFAWGGGPLFRRFLNPMPVARTAAGLREMFSAILRLPSLIAFGLSRRIKVGRSGVRGAGRGILATARLKTRAVLRCALASVTMGSGVLLREWIDPERTAQATWVAWRLCYVNAR